mmetsp:Transcript_45121/g.59825  ORF Transcript_45121/g.59825 Transcript_45121/m.59825 type:complete len:119 (+) Transcript_45121:77-433(+)|eukprot:CAMPEP_0170450722 /NCGR_PEP_ID=MMETSP0123-20130129/167_1 /TAXON_ID=182087 /ORGANISM="Favella ehrenbergii, Strain Fehren 1" /LENGTH=118 /DNA_ID=CAMNT_0010712105 /DNA_START=66 /DNA_END=422 /DNA_ORIENTATION=-
MTEQIQICQFTRCLAVSELRVGGKLEMFDGSIQAIYEEIVDDKKIRMKWKFKEWEDYADCVVDFVSFNDSCEVNVTITNIPSHDSFGSHIHIENIQRGWRENIFKMIYGIFGYPLRDE